MAEVNLRSVPKVPALTGRTVVSLFFEDSTRTRISFETAAKRLSADVMTFNASVSSINKGESIRDTVETISAMGVSAFVVRHGTSGLPQQVTQWTDAAVVNAGDGAHQHPTQALLDCFSLLESYNREASTDCLGGLRIAIVGDVRHSRVARSNIEAFTELGARVILVAPKTLLPMDVSAWNVECVSDLDAILDSVDVVYLLRMQRERMDSAFVPNLSEYSQRYGLDQRRLEQLGDEVRIMHPGPMNRGVEILVDPKDLRGSLVTQQVTNGVAVRMAVLFDLLAQADSIDGVAA
jgi:aspartate carbamoyltransferase catalytic subunit